MGSKVIRNVTKIIKATSGRLFGRVSASTGRAEELTPTQVRTLLSVPTSAEVAAAYQPIGSYATSVHSHSQSDVTGLVSALAAKADLVGGLVPAGQLPSYVDDVVEGANLAAFPGTGESGKIYFALDTGRTYRWSGSAYVELTDSTAVWGSVSGTLSNQTDLQSALTARALQTITITAGTGLSGGGDLSGNRSLAVSFGTTAGTACEGNDSRLTGAVQDTGDTMSGQLVVPTLGVGAATTASGFVEVSPQAPTSNPTVILRSGRNAGDASVNQDIVQYRPRNAATVIGSVDYLGRWTVNPTGSGITTASVDASVIVNTRFSGAVGVLIRGETSQSADLQQWRTVDNVQQTRINSSGAIITLRPITLGVFTVATLPSASANSGAFAQVTDSNSSTNGGTVAGGGANRVPVFSNGTNWIVK